VRYLGGDEEARILSALPARLRPIVITQLLTGLRQGDVLQLRKDAVELVARRIAIIVGKTSKRHLLPIVPALVPVLEASMREFPASDFVFCSRNGRPFTSEGFQSGWKRAVKRAGIPNLRNHDLRHTCATRLRAQGAGLDIIGDVLGHASIAMTTRYAHLGDGVLREAMERLPAPVTPDATPDTEPVRRVSLRVVGRDVTHG